MKVAILGTGNVGQTLAEKFISNGHSVIIGTRNPEDTLSKSGENSFSEWLSKNNSAKLESFANAVKESEIILIALNGANAVNALQTCSKQDFGNKIVIDLTNPLDFSKGFPPILIEGLNNSNSLGEEIQKFIPNAKVVKTLNTMWCGLMLNPSLINNGNHINFVCGNDLNAKQTVTELLMSFGWAKENILDLGDITNSRGTEAYLLLWTRIYGATKSGAFNFGIIK
jgi:8-hydroxy-5-deazaflavin:NADPH oxidoreductase